MHFPQMFAFFDETTVARSGASCWGGIRPQKLHFNRCHTMRSNCFASPIVTLVATHASDTRVYVRSARRFTCATVSYAPCTPSTSHVRVQCSSANSRFLRSDCPIARRGTGPISFDSPFNPPTMRSLRPENEIGRFTTANSMTRNPARTGGGAVDLLPARGIRRLISAFYHAAPPEHPTLSSRRWPPLSIVAHSL